MKALPILTDALNIAGFVSFGEAPKAEETALAVRCLNGMLLEWSTKSIYSPKQYNMTCPANGTSEYRLGIPTGSTIVPDMPTSPKQILQVTTELGTIVYPTAIGTVADFAQVFPKDIVAIPSNAYWDWDQDGSVLYLWPAPPVGMTVRVIGIGAIDVTPNGQGNIDLPDDYTEALVYNLAQRLIPFLPPDATANPQTFAYIDRIAGTSLSGIKRRNANRIDMALVSDYPSVGGRRRGNDGYLTWRGRTP